jgi:hypothetical protein
MLEDSGVPQRPGSQCKQTTASRSVREANVSKQRRPGTSGNQMQEDNAFGKDFLLLKLKLRRPEFTAGDHTFQIFPLSLRLINSNLQLWQRKNAR